MADSRSHNRVVQAVQGDLRSAIPARCDKVVRQSLRKCKPLFTPVGSPHRRSEFFFFRKKTRHSCGNRTGDLRLLRRAAFPLAQSTEVDAQRDVSASIVPTANRQGPMMSTQLQRLSSADNPPVSLYTSQERKPATATCHGAPPRPPDRLGPSEVLWEAPRPPPPWVTRVGAGWVAG